MAQSELIHLVADLSLIHSNAKWRYPGTWQNYAPYGDPELYLDLARLLEHGLFDGAFFADVAGTPMVNGSTDSTVEWGVAWPRHDPLPLAIAMAGVTKHLGFITTMSMTYHHPFNIARLYSSIDHVTGGRIAYNAVVSGFPQEAQNFGYDTTPDHEWRYRRAEEFQTVVNKLWDSVEPDAMLWDRATGRVADPAKVHRIDHEGEHFRVMGPLPVAPSPQGRPIQIMAGQSPSGMALAGKWANVQFAGIAGLEGKAAHRQRLNEVTMAAGRAERDVSILWSAGFDVVYSASEANENRRKFIEMHPEPLAHVFLSQWWGMDGKHLDPDRGVHETIEEIRTEGTHNNNWGYLTEALRVTTPTTTIGEYARDRLNESGADFVGTPEQIADKMEEDHFGSGANGGFMIYPRTGAIEGLSRFVHEVVPVLQYRGLTRSKYEGTTMRENLLG